MTASNSRSRSRVALTKPSREVVADPAHPVVVVEEPRAAGPLEEVEDLLPVPDQVQERGEGPDVHRVGADRDGVGGDPLQLRHHHADGVHVRAHLDAAELLDGEGEAERVAHRRAVVQAVGVGHDAGVVHVLAVLLEAAVEVADVGAGGLDDLAVGAQLHPEHPVGGGVLRPHLEDHLVGVEGVRVPVRHPEGLRSARSRRIRRPAAHCSSTCRLGGVKSKGPTPIASPARARSAICVRRLHVQPVVVLGVLPVLAQRVPLPVVGEEDPARVAVAGERDAEEVPGLALVPVGDAPRLLDGGHRRALPRHLHLQGEGVEVRVGVEVVDHLHPRRRLLRVVDRGEAHEVVEGEGGVGLAEGRDLGDGVRRHHREGRRGLEARARDLLPELRDQRLVDGLGVHGYFVTGRSEAPSSRAPARLPTV